MPVVISFEIRVPKGKYVQDTFEFLMQELTRTLRQEVSDLLIGELKRRTANWRTDVTFRSIFTAGRNRLRLDVEPFGEGRRLWRWVSGGVGPHMIAPTNAPMLRIRRGYRSKTDVGDVYGRTSFYAGPFYKASRVFHPGMEPREFEKHIVNKTEYKVVNMLQQAVWMAIVRKRD